ncbi:MAG: hypothetical protein AAGJ93_05860 [Bacteroidota bacterium]
MPYKLLLLSFFFLLSAFSLQAQSKTAFKEEAKAYIAAAHYDDAIRTLESSRNLVRNDKEAQFLLAVCHYQLNNLDRSLELLTNLLNAEKSPYPECRLYLGKVYHARQQFAEAAEQYKLYLRTLRAEHPNRQMVIEDIRRCDNGLRWLYVDGLSVVENIGPMVNTAYDEYGPVLSPNRASKLYFSASKPDNSGGLRNSQHQPDDKFGHPRSDMFSTQLVGGQWQSPQGLHYLLNTPQQEYLAGFTGNGQVLLYFQGWNEEQGVIFADTFQQNEQRSLKTTPFLGEAKGSVGEHQLFIYNDTLLLFASRRPGGYGGLDLYRSSFKNGRWTTAENLGPTINSAFDETTPFLARNGLDLFYSTNNSRLSVGGLDIVRSVYLPDAQRWSAPKNMGLPINSPADDAHFRLANDGFTAFLSSSRKDGMGQRDIYAVYFTKYRQEMEPPLSAFQTPVQQNNPQVSTTIVPPPSPVVKVPVVENTPSSNQWKVEANTLMQLSSGQWTEEVIAAMRQFPQDQLLVTCYIPQAGNGISTARLYDAITQLRTYSRSLVQGGVSAERIFLRAQLHQGTSNILMLSLATPPGRHFRDNLPILGNSFYDGPGVAADQALCYKVQVVSVQKSYDNTDLSQRDDLMLENAAHLPYLRYTAGAATTFSAANRIRRQLAAAGYSGAYVVPYVYGIRLERDQVASFSNEFPDLRNYLSR